MNPQILKMQQDLEKFRASKMGGAVPSDNPPVNQPVAPTSTAPVSGIDSDLKKYRELKSKGTLPSQDKLKKPSFLAAMAKGIFSAPATMLARPVQAAVAVGSRLDGDGGISNEQIDEATAKIPVVGGLIAPTPKNFDDVKKDVGRAAQTVALGTGAPIAGGALFGAGTSLEQGNDLLSAETAFNALTGGASGKVLQWVGKPILNVAGKVVGTITPKMIKDAAAGGAKAMQKFMADHQLLGGIAAKPSEAIATGLQKVDDTIEGAVSKAGTGAKNIIKEQYPGVDIQKHFVEKNKADIVRPTTVNEPKYYKAKAVYDDAKRRGIDIEEIGSKRGVIHDKIAEGNSYNSKDYADTIRANVYQVEKDITRPALKALEPETQLVSIPEIRGSMINQIDNIPDNQITAEAREVLKRKITKQYADNSALARKYPRGMSLTNLHDARIISGKNGKYKPGADPSATLAAQMAREEGFAYAKILDDILPDEFKAMRRTHEEDFILADYLNALHGRKVPEGITKKAVRLFGRAAAATVGGKVGGFPGSILGAQYGDMLFNTFQTLPNPLKVKVLSSIKLENPAAYTQLVKLIGDKEMARLTTLALPPAGQSTFKEQGPRLFATPGGVSTPFKQEAVDITSVESGAAKLPKTSPMYKQKVKEIQDRLEPYLTPEEMTIIQMGPKSRKGLGLPNAEGSPNVYTPPQKLANALQLKLEKYLTPEEMEIIDWGPKPKPKKKSLSDIYID